MAGIAMPMGRRPTGPGSASSFMKQLQEPLKTFAVCGFKVEVTRMTLVLMVVYSFILSVLLWPLGVPVVVIFLSCGVVLGMTLSVLVHELAHAFTMRRVGWVCASIKLSATSGQAVPQDVLITLFGTPKHIFLVAAAGPAANLVLGGMLWGVYAGVSAKYGHPPTAGLIDLLPEVGREMGWASGALIWLYLAFFLNIAGGVFNYLPVYPLDGGLMLFAVIAGYTKSRRTAAIMTMYRVNMVMALLLLCAAFVAVIRYGFNPIIVIISLVQLGIRMLPTFKLARASLNVLDAYDTRASYVRFVNAYAAGATTTATATADGTNGGPGSGAAVVGAAPGAASPYASTPTPTPSSLQHGTPSATNNTHTHPNTSSGAVYQQASSLYPTWYPSHPTYESSQGQYPYQLGPSMQTYDTAVPVGIVVGNGQPSNALMQHTPSHLQFTGVGVVELPRYIHDLSIPVAQPVGYYTTPASSDVATSSSIRGSMSGAAAMPLSVPTFSIHPTGTNTPQGANNRAGYTFVDMSASSRFAASCPPVSQPGVQYPQTSTTPGAHLQPVLHLAPSGAPLATHSFAPGSGRGP